MKNKTQPRRREGREEQTRRSFYSDLPFADFLRALCAFAVVFSAGCAANHATTQPIAASPATAPSSGGIVWEKYSDDVFARAKKQNKFVLLDLEAVWCHWCHVMDETTYKDPKVIQLMHDRYIAVRVDQDARPDISSRYEDYGWPATVVFNGEGGEIVKRRGYLPPEEMSSMLQAIILDPTPGPSIQAAVAVKPSENSSLTDEVRKELQSRITSAYDKKYGAWGRSQKFMYWDNVEWCLVKAAAGDEDSKQMARQTLTEQLHLLDPTWGGVYQYSTDGDWDHQHFEKILQFQAENLRTYSQAYALWHDSADLDAAQKIRGFLKTFLTSPQGAFYTSMDADLVDGVHSADYFQLDDAGRRAQGIPRIDKHMYSRENGWVINALVELYCASGDKSALQDAQKAAHWVIDNRSLPEGGFRHDERDAAGPYLADTMSMGRAFLALYAATGQRQWLDRAQQTAPFIQSHFKLDAGYATAAGKASSMFHPDAEGDENIMLARFANLLFRYTGEKGDRDIAEHAMKFIASPDIALNRGFGVGGILLADRELGAEPAHIAIVGKRDDPKSRELFALAIGYFDQYKRIDLVEPGAPPLPNTDTTYPELATPAAFLCAGGACSAPMSNPEKFSTKLAAVAKR